MSETSKTTEKIAGRSNNVGLRGAVIRDPSQREAQRQQALLAAARVFARKGYEAATMDDIAREFGVSKGVLYYQFRSKQELIVETRRAASGRSADRLEEIIGQDLPSAERMRLALRDLIAMNFDELARHVILTSLRFGLDQEHVNEVRKVERRYEGLLISLVREGIDDGSFVSSEPRLTALTLISAAMAPANWFRPGGNLSEGQIIDGLTKQLLRSITRSIDVDEGS